MSDIPSLVDARCEATSPIAKFDGGPIRCQANRGHKGDHYGKNYDVSYEAFPGGFTWRRWNDKRITS